jgi:hypothetical protein
MGAVIAKAQKFSLKTPYMKQGRITQTASQQFVFVRRVRLRFLSRVFLPACMAYSGLS